MTALLDLATAGTLGTIALYGVVAAGTLAVLTLWWGGER